MNGDVGQQTDQPDGDYLLKYDPLDGSSNLDVNLSAGITGRTTETGGKLRLLYKASPTAPLSDVVFFCTGVDLLVHGGFCYL